MLTEVTNIADREDVGTDLLFYLQVELLHHGRAEVRCLCNKRECWAGDALSRWQRETLVKRCGSTGNGSAVGSDVFRV